MPRLGHRHRYFLRIVHLFLLICAGKTHRRPARTVSGLPTGRPWDINKWPALPVRQQTNSAKTSLPQGLL
jgi:hypothetical protein